MSSDHEDGTRNLEDARMREILGTLRQDVRAPSGLRDSVMREIEVDHPSLTARVVDWVFRPRMVPVSPAVAGLAVAAVVALVFVWPASSPVGTPSVEALEAPARVVTRFVLVAPGASTVHVTGDFVSWSREGIPLEDLRGTGIWTGDLALPPGVHRYTFVVNGSEWVPDPSAVLQVDDGFGQRNSIVVVAEAGEA